MLINSQNQIWLTSLNGLKKYIIHFLILDFSDFFSELPQFSKLASPYLINVAIYKNEMYYAISMEYSENLNNW